MCSRRPARAALLTGKERLELVEQPLSEPGPREVLVEVLACGVCATDVRKFLTLDNGMLELPMNLGHEYVGRVVAVGSSVDHIVVGERIVGDGYAGYADYALIPLDLKPPLHVPRAITLPDEVTDEEAIYVEPLADCLHALYSRAHLMPGEHVFVIGGGVMGQLLGLCAQLTGGEVILAEPNEARGKAARNAGLSVIQACVAETNPPAELSALGPPDLVVCSIGTEASLQAALKAVRNGGRILVFGGFPKGSVQTAAINELHYREISVIGTHWVGASAGTYSLNCYPAAIRLLHKKLINVRPMTSHVFELRDITKAFAVARSLSSLKVIIKPNVSRRLA
jgi:L-iditol 2-dehydrogenase